MEWEQQYHEDKIEETMKYLKNRRQRDPLFTKEACEKTLETLYENQGSNWIGKGSMQEMKEAATVVAYELFLSNWEDGLEEDLQMLKEYMVLQKEEEQKHMQEVLDEMEKERKELEAYSK